MKKRQIVILVMMGAAMLSLSSCGSSKAAGNSIESAQWKLESMNGEKNKAFAESDSFTLEFLKKEGRIAGVGACNRFFGNYELAKKGEIDIKMGGATMMACPNLNLEAPYFKMLDEADKYKIEKEKLLLYIGDKVTAVFTQYTKPAALDMHNAQNSLNYVGKYTGTLPAADCPGIKTTVTLNKDNTCTVIMDYIDRDTKFTEQGKYSIAGNLITVETSDGKAYYKVGENTITRLDNECNPITGDLASMYVLNKL
ncbi:MAG: copper resistance protein NlpE N-terminal domain-containing protein [Bacteroidales bacterium]